MNLCPRWLRLPLSLPSLRPTASLRLALRHPPMFPAVLTIGGVVLPQNMPFLDLAMKSLLVRPFSSTNRNRNLTPSPGQSLQQLKKEFADMRNTFNSRYVRLYGACDDNGFYDDVIEAAWYTSLGVHALIWVSLHATCMPTSSLLESQFGFDGTDEWVGRRDSLFRTLHSNPKAKFVTRVVQFGSEPLYDNALSPNELAAQVWSAKVNLSSLNIPVTVSELAYGYQERGGAQNVLDAIDSINIHMLPFFSSKASTGKASPADLLSDRHSASHRSERLAPGSR
jgi:hypothetical protein